MFSQRARYYCSFLLLADANNLSRLCPQETMKKKDSLVAKIVEYEKSTETEMQQARVGGEGAPVSHTGQPVFAWRRHFGD